MVVDSRIHQIYLLEQIQASKNRITLLNYHLKNNILIN